MTAPPVVDEQAVRRALREVKDPELDMNIIDLGLVYEVEVDGGEVRVKMTLTSPGCPAGPMITNDAYRVIRGLAGVQDVDIEIVWEPYWTPERMDPKVRALMGL
ncbi:MAG TPA: metal-sulfur cluster assembly factor [Gemmatimonadales bacterium]